MGIKFDTLPMNIKVKQLDNDTILDWIRANAKLNLPLPDPDEWDTSLLGGDTCSFAMESHGQVAHLNLTVDTGTAGYRRAGVSWNTIHAFNYLIFDTICRLEGTLGQWQDILRVYDSSGNLYGFRCYSSDTQIYKYDVAAGTTTTLASLGSGKSSGTDYKWKFEINTQTGALKWYENGSVILSATDTSYSDFVKIYFGVFANDTSGSKDLYHKHFNMVIK